MAQNYEKMIEERISFLLTSQSQPYLLLLCFIFPRMFNLPNVLTVSNLFFGCCALISLNQGKDTQCIEFIMLAAIVDFLDGFVARKMKLESKLGGQLDSLSDIVSFGVVPAMICFQILQSLKPETLLFPYLSFALALAAAFRLARFNVSSSGQDLFFTGLPVPANGLFFCGILQLRKMNFEFHDVVFNPIFFSGMVLLFSYLMVSHWKVLKIHLHKNWLQKYGIILVIEIISLGSAYWIGAAVFSLVILVHIVASLFLHFFQNKISTT